MQPLFELSNPLRRPDWRAQRVHEILASGPGRLPSRTFDDAPIWEFFRYRQYWDAAEDEQQKRDIRLAGCEFYYADQLHRDRQTDLPALVEAQLLAGLDDQTIARSVGTLPGAIERYEQLFFNVRDRLAVENWILQVVLAGEFLDAARRFVPTAARHRRLLYKLAGYAGGAEALEQVMGGRRNRQPESSFAAINWCEQELLQTLRFKGLQAARLIEVTPDNALAIVGMLLKLMEFHQRERLVARQEGEGESTPILDVARDVFSNLKLMMSPDAISEMSPEVRAVFESPVELRMRDRCQFKESQQELQHLSQLEQEIREQRSADGPRLTDSSTDR